MLLEFRLEMKRRFICARRSYPFVISFTRKSSSTRHRNPASIAVSCTFAREKDSRGSPARSNIQVLPSAGSSQSLSPGDAPSACPTIGPPISTPGESLFSTRALCSLLFPLEYRRVQVGVRIFQMSRHACRVAPKNTRLSIVYRAHRAGAVPRNPSITRALCIPLVHVDETEFSLIRFRESVRIAPRLAWHRNGTHSTEEHSTAQHSTEQNRTVRHTAVPRGRVKTSDRGTLEERKQRG